MILIIIIIIKNNFTDRRIFSVPLHRSENLKKKKGKRKRFVSALPAEQQVGFHRDGRAGAPSVGK